MTGQVWWVLEEEVGLREKEDEAGKPGGSIGEGSGVLGWSPRKSPGVSGSRSVSPEWWDVGWTETEVFPSRHKGRTTDLQKVRRPDTICTRNLITLHQVLCQCTLSHTRFSCPMFFYVDNL